MLSILPSSSGVLLQANHSKRKRKASETINEPGSKGARPVPYLC